MMDQWWKDAIIYAVDVERFYDSNGDGIGDFPGLTSRLEYIADLGITCLWLLPFYSTINRDNGYDVTDYFNTDSRLGTLDDFIHFVHRSGELGIRVIIDLVTNHTSNKHPWFQAGRQNENSRYRDYYYWSANPPPTPTDMGPMFPGEENSVWTYDEVARSYYYHRFYHHEPSLNPNNPDVRAELERVLDFWTSFGISGFRVDAAAHMVKAPSPEFQTLDDPHDTLREIHTRAKKLKSDSVLIGEVDEDPKKMKEFLDGKQLDMMFNFLLNNHLFLALATEKAEHIVEGLNQLPILPPQGQWTNFLRNFDEANFQQLSKDNQNIILKKFAPKEEMRIYGRGMRRRVASIFEGNVDQLKMAYSLLYSMPGIPSFVYGDEIGMGEDLDQPMRFSVRSPMQWSDKKNAGFSKAIKSKLIQPVIEKGPYAHKTINVMDQLKDSDSLLSFIKKLNYIRRDLSIARQENMQIVTGISKNVIAIVYKDRNQFTLILNNLSGKTVRGSMDIPNNIASLIDLFSQKNLDIKNNTFNFSLAPYGFQWLSKEEKKL